MNPRVFLVGFLGGILAASLLRSPLYSAFPTPYVADWTGTTQLPWIVLGAAILLIILTGAAAAWISGLKGGAGGTLAGAAAGLLAGGLVFASSGAALAGVYGNRILLVRPMEAAASDAKMLALISEALLQTMFWTHIAAWLFVLGGAVLGALGGALMGRKRRARGGRRFTFLLPRLVEYRHCRDADGISGAHRHQRDQCPASRTN